MYFKIENLLKKRIISLKKKGLFGIKAEFEAEGSSLRDIINLRILTLQTNTKLFVKIGGAEAINDIKKCIELNIDGIIAPMIETEFALSKFIGFFKKKNFTKLPHLSINIETKEVVKNLSKILIKSKVFINNITIGRTDLSKSLEKKAKIDPDSSRIYNMAIGVAKVSKKYSFDVTVGGSINFNTLKNLNNKIAIKNISRIETRKVIFPIASFLKKGVLDEALDFEEKYILYKNHITENDLANDNSRLAILKTRK